MNAVARTSFDDSLGPELAAHLARAVATAAYGDLLNGRPVSFTELPLTSAAQVKAEPANFMLPLTGPGVRVASSGSTGTPTAVYRTPDELYANAAGIAARLDASMLPAGPRRVASFLSHDHSAAGTVIEHVMLHANAVLGRMIPYRPSGANWPQFAAAMEELAPNVLVGTPGVLLDIEHELHHLGAFGRIRDQVSTVLTIGATSTPAMRRRLTRSWQALVSDLSFGGTEPGTIATGCRLGNLHSMLGRGVYEVVTEDGTIVPLRAGFSGELVVTPTLFQHFILVRYLTGDRIHAVDCPCGLDGVAFKVLGRSDDRVRVGEHWVGQAEIEEAVYADPTVEDYQLVADLDLSLRRVEISLMPGVEDRGAEAATISRRLDVDTVVVDLVSPFARNAGVVKSWVRTRIRREVS